MQGGKRLNAGRPKGSRKPETIAKEMAEKLMKQRILKRLNPLLNSQFSLAEGVSYVYKVVETGSGKDKKRDHVLVESPEEIKEFLDEHEGGDGLVEDTYYYITTKTPDNKAIDSMLDRVFGKATQKLAGDKDDRTPIPLLYGLHNNDGDK